MTEIEDGKFTAKLIEAYSDKFNVYFLTEYQPYSLFDLVKKFNGSLDEITASRIFG